MSTTQKFLHMEREKGDEVLKEESKAQDAESQRTYERWKSVKILKGH